MKAALILLLIMLALIVALPFTVSESLASLAD
jgi:hypothetical protein